MRRLRLKWLLATGVVTALTLGISVRLVRRSRLRFPYLTGTLAPEQYRELAAKPGWSKAELEVAPGVNLLGLTSRPQSPTAPWLLFYPGNDARQLERGQAFLARVRGERDWGLAVFAYRGFNSSPGVPVLSDLAADAATILRKLSESEHISSERMNVVGFSIGGHLAVRAVGAATRAGRPPATLTLLASVDDIVMVRRSFWDRLDPGDDYQTRPFLGDVKGPVLVMQGAADEALRGPAQGRDIAAALGSRARYVELPGVGHSALIETETAIVALRQFVAQHQIGAQ